MRVLLTAFAVALVACSSSGSGTFVPETPDASTDAPSDTAPADVVDSATPDVSVVDAARDVTADAPSDVPLFVDGSTRTPVCERCTSQADCGADGVCVEVATGARACLPRCNPDVPVCPGRLRCVRDVALADVAVCAPVGGTCCIDGDNDGYGAGVGCRGADCNDSDPARTTSGAETCNNADDDCDGMVDEGLSRACSTACGAGTETCARGAWGGCTARVPAMETCGNRVDDDCDGMTDEGCVDASVPDVSVPDATVDAGPVPLCTMGPVVESTSGDYLIIANYDGGDVDLDVDRPIANIAVIAYEPVRITLRGSALASVRRVHVVGYNSLTATVSGVSPSIVELAGMPAATLADPAGNARMVCASTCRPGTRPGGCNTLEQVLDYFRNVFGTGRAWWHMQYGTFTGRTFRVSEGGCCV